MLSNLFGQMGYKPIVKPSREVTVDDLTQHNVIMLGSSSQNIAVAHFSNPGDFRFKDFDTRLEQWRGVIVNPILASTKRSTYHTERDPNTQVLNADYSLITIQPGDSARAVHRRFWRSRYDRLRRRCLVCHIKVWGR